MTEARPLARAGEALRTLSHLYTRLMLALAAALIVAITVVMGLQVFYRYVLNDSLIWAEEVCRYGLIWVTFLFAGIAFQRGEMVALTFARDILPGKLRLLFMVLGYTSALILLWVLAYYGYIYAQRNVHQSMPAARFILEALLGQDSRPRLSIFWVYIAVPIGLSILSIHVLVAMIRNIGESLSLREPGS